MESNPRTLRDNALKQIKLGKERFQSSQTYENQLDAYQVLYSGLEDFKNYIKIQKNNDLLIQSKEYYTMQINLATKLKAELERLKPAPEPQEKEKNQILDKSEIPQNISKVKKIPLSAIKSNNNSNNNEQDEMEQTMMDTILTEKPNVKWDDIAGLQTAKNSLKEAVILPTQFPHLFTGNLKPWKGILLYGPPGTGKTQLAKACATECNATFFSISASDLMSKWVGEAEKKIQVLFQIAREKKPSIIFIDELDSIAGQRNEGSPENTARVKTELLVQMDGVGKDSEGVLVLGATNLPDSIDQAVRRRFEKRIMIDLPNEKARKELFKNLLKGTDNNLIEKNFELLAQQTDGYSGSDLSILVRDAAYQSLRYCQNAQNFRQVKVGDITKYSPCTEKEKDALKMTINDIQSGELILNPVTMDDFLRGLQKTKPSVSQSDLEKYIEFTKNFGQECN